MMACCSVKHCLNNRKFPSQEKTISFHVFPRDNRLKTWLDLVDIKGDKFVWTKNKNICSEHFTEEDFMILSGKRYLKQNAVPSLNLGKLIASSSLCESNSPLRSPVTSNSTTPLITTKADESTKDMPSSSTSVIPSTKVHVSIPVSFNESGLQAQLIRRKRNLSSSQDSSSSGESISSGGKRRKVQFIKTIHSYSVSSEKIRTNYLKSRYSQLKKKLYNVQRQAKNKKTQITSSKTILAVLNKKQNLSNYASHHLEKCLENVPQLVMKRYIKNTNPANTTQETYPVKLQQFAFTLQFYSSRTYEYVRKTFALALPNTSLGCFALPHPANIRKWSQNIDCYPGFCTPAFDALEEKVKSKRQGTQIFCSLLLDEMAIRKQVDFDGKHTWGYVNVGAFIENDDMEIASEALVLMVVSQNSHWKLPIAYFLIKYLTGREKANIIKEALIRLHAVGVVVTSITGNGPSANLRMLKELGCEFDELHNMKTWFHHPVSQEKIFCFLDICHMIKLSRIMFATLGRIKTRDGLVDWRFVQKLYELQESENFWLKTKLRGVRMEWYKHKIKVNLAAQTLSSSVADAISFLEKDVKLPDFQGAEATVLFIRRIDSLFDLLNSKSPWAKGFKGPLSQRTEEFWKPFLMDSCEYFLDCRDVQETPLYMTPKKTPIYGLVISAISCLGMYANYVLTNRLNYLLTYKCSQDHLQMFFCLIRSKNGWNDNPTSLQFMHAFKKVLLASYFRDRGGNCHVLDITVFLEVPSTKNAIIKEGTIDLSLLRKYNPSTEIPYYDYNVLPDFIDLRSTAINVVTYIAGYVIKMLKNISKCPECYVCCFENVRGELNNPSYGVVKVCEATETAIKRLMVLTNNKIPAGKGFLLTFTVAISQKFYSNYDLLFPKLIEHNTHFDILDKCHTIALIEQIITAYTKIRFHNLAKKYINKIEGTRLRKELSKIILFNQQ